MRKLLLLIFTLFTACSLSLFIPNFTQAATDNGEFTVQTIPGQTVAEKITARTKTSWPWYLTRASGIIAAITLVILMLSGIGQVTGFTFRFLDPLTSWASHRALGIAFGISVLIHMFSLLFDHFVKFNLWHILIPWLSNYHPVTIWGFHLGSLYLALGVLAFYMVAIIVISSLVWVEKKPYIWKWLHLLSYLTILFVFVHALYLGSDLKHGFLRWIWIFIGIAIFVATMQRLRRANTT